MKRACPNCNSPQSLKPRTRDLGGDRAEIFIRCTMCRWEAILFSGTEDQVRLKKDIDKLRSKALQGVPIGGVLLKRRERMRDSF